MSFFRSIINNALKSTSKHITTNSATNTVSGATKSSITVYHNTNSLLSHNLLSRLSSYSLLPCTKHKQDDLSIPSLTTKFDIDVKFNQSLSMNDSKFINDQCIDIHPNNNSILNQLKDKNQHFPLIIDYNNKLVANDEESFNRIMMNYLSCGIQHADKAELPYRLQYNSNNKNKVDEIPQPDLVHPHVAEFADLF